MDGESVGVWVVTVKQINFNTRVGKMNWRRPVVSYYSFCVSFDTVTCDMDKLYEIVKYCRQFSFLVLAHGVFERTDRHIIRLLKKTKTETAAEDL